MVAKKVVRGYTVALVFSIAAIAGGRPDGEEGGSCGCGIDTEIPRIKIAATEGVPMIDALGTNIIEDMKYIEGGRGYIGTDSPAIWRDGEGPRRPVHVSSFFLDTHEVTNYGMSEFVLHALR